MGDHINLIDESGLLDGGNIHVVVPDDEQHAPPAGPMHWTPVQSGFMLRRFHDLVVQGVKTDKGFKEVHVRQVATILSKFAR
jgi:hypothetical protein